MNSKGIKALEEDVCLVCQKEKPTHVYSIFGRGYGSCFDNDRIEFKCCDKCDKPEFRYWFNEESEDNEFCEVYTYEENIMDLFKSLPLNSQERVFNTSDWIMEPQDWIDYKLNELSHEMCKEYGRYSPQEIQAYNDRFPVCDKVFREVYYDGSSCCCCNYGAAGNSDGSCGLNISDDCYMCAHFEVRSDHIKTVDVAEEEVKRETERLLEMLAYAAKHLDEIGLDVMRHTADFIGVNQ